VGLIPTTWSITLGPLSAGGADALINISGKRSLPKAKDTFERFRWQ
jgi:hypothetical protein